MTDTAKRVPSSPVKERTRILPCPFCGNAPEVMGSGEGQRGLMIHCIGEDCPNPSVSYYDHTHAIRVWNRRHLELGND